LRECYMGVKRLCTTSRRTVAWCLDEAQLSIVTETELVIVDGLAILYSCSGDSIEYHHLGMKTHNNVQNMSNKVVINDHLSTVDLVHKKKKSRASNHVFSILHCVASRKSTQKTIPDSPILSRKHLTEQEQRRRQCPQKESSGCPLRCR
jgi:hypothetical protein